MLVTIRQLILNSFPSYVQYKFVFTTSSTTAVINLLLNKDFFRKKIFAFIRVSIGFASKIYFPCSYAVLRSFLSQSAFATPTE